MAKKPKIQPFEWLTSPESIGRFVREHVLLNQKSASSDGSETCDSLSRQPTAMHIGCGSSTVGEYLVRELGFSKVVNVDRDRETLEGMAERWTEMTKNTHSEDISDSVEEKKDASPEGQKPLLLEPGASIADDGNKMEFWCLDYTAQTLPEDYSDSFDLVVDKSTLDCTLCSDCSATAAFLSEIYRTLKTNNGIYLVISFHELDLILPLLRDLPGAHWTVSHTTMERQVECIRTNTSGNTAKTPKSLQINTDCANDTEDVVSNRKPLNVLIARKLSVCEKNIDRDTSAAIGSSHPGELIIDEVVKHVQEVNDRWFQDEQPLLTNERIEGLKSAFFGNENDSKELALEKAYDVIFTDAEREHLTYQHFLEDWEAFCQEEHDGPPNQEALSISAVTYDLALSFLRANQ